MPRTLNLFRLRPVRLPRQVEESAALAGLLNLFKQFQVSSRPPVTGINWPVIKPASSEAR